MARPLRIEFPGAVYHVTARGDRREPIFVDDDDRHALLEIVAQGLSRFDAEAWVRWGQALPFASSWNRFGSDHRNALIRRYKPAI